MFTFTHHIVLNYLLFVCEIKNGFHRHHNVVGFFGPHLQPAPDIDYIDIGDCGNWDILELRQDMAIH